LQRNINSRLYKILTAIENIVIYTGVTRDLDELEYRSYAKYNEYIAVVFI